MEGNHNPFISIFYCFSISYFLNKKTFLLAWFDGNALVLNSLWPLWRTSSSVRSDCAMHPTFGIFLCGGLSPLWTLFICSEKETSCSFIDLRTLSGYFPLNCIAEQNRIRRCHNSMISIDSSNRRQPNHMIYVQGILPWRRFECLFGLYNTCDDHLLAKSIFDPSQKWYQLSIHRMVGSFTTLRGTRTTLFESASDVFLTALQCRLSLHYCVIDVDVHHLSFCYSPIHSTLTFLSVPIVCKNGPVGPLGKWRTSYLSCSFFTSVGKPDQS